MVKNPRLSKTTIDAGGRDCRERLFPKTAETGRTLTEVHAAYLSQTCSFCDRTFPERIYLSVRTAAYPCGPVLAVIDSLGLRRSRWTLTYDGGGCPTSSAALAQSGRHSTSGGIRLATRIRGAEGGLRAHPPKGAITWRNARRSWR